MNLLKFDNIQFPVNPENITITNGVNYSSCFALEGNEIVKPSSSQTREITCKGILTLSQADEIVPLINQKISSRIVSNAEFNTSESIICFIKRFITTISSPDGISYVLIFKEVC